MTSISDDDVRSLARLSAISLSDTEVTDLQKDIERIITYIDQLAELDTTGIEPTYQVHSYTEAWRDDTIDYSVSSEELIALAEQHTADSIVVPKVL